MEMDKRQDAISCTELFLLVGDVMARVTWMQIEEKPGCHGRLYVEAETGAEFGDAAIYEGNGAVCIGCQKDGGQIPIFQGMLTRLEAKNAGDICRLRVEAATFSLLLDIQRHTLAYQDPGISFHRLIQQVISVFPGAQAMIGIPDQPVGQIEIQYQETVWEFVKRLSAQKGSFVYADSQNSSLCLFVGLPYRKVDVVWDDSPYTTRRDMRNEELEGMLAGTVTHFLETYDFVPLGSTVDFHGQECFVTTVGRYLKDGLLVNTYTLCTEQGQKRREYDNPLLCGVSLYGTVADVKRNRVRVMLEQDALSSSQEPYYYAFSTVAASPDGNGWYCMPKAGDPVRVFFPTGKERDGYVIANVKGKSSPEPGSPIGNPELKDITTPDGKTLQFISGGILLSVSGQSGVVTLTSGKKAEIASKQSISVSAAEEILLATEGEVACCADGEIQMNCDGGGSISIKGDTITVSAGQIENN